MKKINLFALCALVILGLSACAPTENKAGDSSPNVADSKAEAPKAPEAVTIEALNAAGELAEITVPYQPKRVAVFNLAVLDMLDAWGLADSVVGMPKASEIDYLMKYNANEDIANLGTLKEVDMEALMAAQPDIIFISGRLSAQYDALSKIAPVVYTETGHESGYLKNTKENAQRIATIFGVQEQVDHRFADFDARITALKAAADGKSAVVGLVTSSSFNTLGNGTRGSLIGNEIGFKNLAADVNSTHGNESSFELLLNLNPEYIFVLDRDSATNAKGAPLASQVMDNELVHKTTAYQNGNVVYLTPSVWYLVEGGLTSTDMMLQDMEKVLLKN